MANNIPITAGSGTTVATDDVAGAHVQLVKLVDGTEDSSARIPGDATNGLDVDVTRLPALPAGSNNIGDVDVLTLPALPAGTNNIGDVDVLSLPALPAGTNNIGDVDVLSLPALPTGSNTIGKLAANSGVDIGDVDVTSLPSLPAGSNNIGDVDVLTLPALPAGTNAIGKLAANSGVDIGDVDVTSVIPGTGATNLGKAEDAAHTDGDVGVLMLGVRNYGGAGTDGDYSTFSFDPDGPLKARVRHNPKRFSVTSGGLTIATTAYSAGDQVGTEFAFANIVPAAGGFGYITQITLQNVGDVIGPYDVILLRDSGTPAADNAAFNVSTTDIIKVITTVPLEGAYDLGAARVATSNNIRVPFDCVGTTLYAWLLCRSGHTFFTAVTDLRLVLQVEQS